MSTTDIYASSYLEPDEDDDVEATPEDIQRFRGMDARKKMGLLLQGEKSRNQRIHEKAKRLQEENLQLRDTIKKNARKAAPHLKEEQKKNDILQRKVVRLEEENRRLINTVTELQKDARLRSY